jgi:hypothetical protein
MSESGYLFFKAFRVKFCVFVFCIHVLKWAVKCSCFNTDIKQNFSIMFVVDMQRFLPNVLLWFLLYVIFHVVL